MALRKQKQALKCFLSHQKLRFDVLKQDLMSTAVHSIHGTSSLLPHTVQVEGVQVGIIVNKSNSEAKPAVLLLTNAPVLP